MRFQHNKGNMEKVNINGTLEIESQLGQARFEPATIKQLVPVLFRRHLGNVIRKTTKKVVF
jgi:hypothetical protein